MLFGAPESEKELIAIDGAGHNGLFDEPEAFAAAIERFLARIAR